MTNDELNKLIKRKVIPALRRVSRWWGPKSDALRFAKVGPNQYKCKSCNEVFGIKEIKMDHVKPVVDVKTGFQTWDIYISRMFCDSDGFQSLCNSCHDVKTQVESEQRKKYRKKRKKVVAK